MKKNSLFVRLVLAAIVACASGAALSATYPAMVNGTILHDDLLAGQRIRNGGQSPEDLNRFAKAVGLYEGVHDMLTYLKTSNNLDIKVCFPSNVTSKQLEAVVTKHMEDHPKEWNLGAVEIILNAYVATFPCDGGK